MCDNKDTDSKEYKMPGWLKCVFALIFIQVILGYLLMENDHTIAEDTQKIQLLYDSLYCFKHKDNQIARIIATNDTLAAKVQFHTTLDSLSDSLVYTENKEAELYQSIHSQLCKFEENRSKNYNNKIIELDTRFALWVTLLAGIATIISVGLVFKETNEIKDLKRKAQHIENKIDKEKERTEVLTVVITVSQILITLNSLRQFEDKDSMLQLDKPAILTLLESAKQKITDKLPIASSDDSSDDDDTADNHKITDIKSYYLIIYQHVNNFIAGYEYCVNLLTDKMKLYALKCDIQTESKKLISEDTPNFEVSRGIFIRTFTLFDDVIKKK